MQKCALVTGAKGHTGSFLVQELVNNGWKVVAMDLPPKDRSDLMVKERVFRSDLQYMTIDLPGVKFIPADLTKKESLYALFDHDMEFDAIFHPASLYDYFAELDILRRINVGGLENFLQVIVETYEKKHKEIPHFLHWSTCGVYGQPNYKKSKDGFIEPGTEEMPYDPPNFYSISKKEQEEKLKEYAAKYKMKYTIIRPGPIYGPYQTYGMFHIFYLCNKLGVMPIPHIVPKNKRLMMPMVHVEDLVRGALYLANNPKAYGEAYNLIGDCVSEEDWMEFTFQELDLSTALIPLWWPLYKVSARAIEWNLKGQNIKARKEGKRPKIDLSMAEYMTHQYYFSNEKIKALGFKFKYGNPYVGTHQTIQWYFEHGWLEREQKLYYPPEPATEAK